MRKLIITTFITLDGVVEAPGGEEGHPHTGWSAEFMSDEYLNYKLDELSNTGAILLGRKTYDQFAEAWPGREDEMGFSEKMNSLPKYVASTTLENPEWNNTTVIKDNIVEELLKLKEQDGNDIVVHGSGTLAQTLIQNDLVDEYRLMLHPVIVGGGSRLFENGLDKKKFKLREVKPFSTGTIVLEYERE